MHIIKYGVLVKIELFVAEIGTGKLKIQWYNNSNNIVIIILLLFLEFINYNIKGVNLYFKLEGLNSYSPHHIRF